MIKKILLSNRKIIKHVTPYMFCAGTLLLVAVGFSIIAGKPLNVDFSHQPMWVGHVYVWVGMLLIIGLMVDMTYKIYHHFRVIRPKETLSQKIQRVENIK